jgi:hypothetical protein
MELSRPHVRYIGAAAAAAMAGIYFLIGLSVLDIGGTTSGAGTDQLGFGFSAGAVFLATALLLLLSDRRWVWVVAAAFQVLVYIIYVGASGVREPHFEVWGITLRIVQIPLLIALAYLALKGQGPTAIRHRR